MRMVVVLPAPLRPTRPMRSPGWMRSAEPSVDSSVRAPARTSRSVAVITLLTYPSVYSSSLLLVTSSRLLELALVGEDRGSFLGARSDRLLEVGGEQTHVEL